MNPIRHFVIVLSCLVFGVVSCSTEPSQTPGPATQQQAPKQKVEHTASAPAEEHAASAPAEEHAASAPAEEHAASAPLESSTPLAPEIPAEYSLSVDPKLLANGNVQLEIESNIPGTIEVMADLSLHGQADGDVWIGKNERVRLSNGRGMVTFTTSDLPKGKYDAEVSFYPHWGFKDSTSRATGISNNLSASSGLTLSGAGESVAAVQLRENGQKWVMEHVSMGDPWRSADWIQRFGKYEELRVDRGNPDILKAYYFPRIDITLIVNTLKKEITVWRLGKARS